MEDDDDDDDDDDDADDDNDNRGAVLVVSFLLVLYAVSDHQFLLQRFIGFTVSLYHQMVQLPLPHPLHTLMHTQVQFRR